jgi:hypothetical protein
MYLDRGYQATSRHEIELKSEEKRALVILGITAIFASIFGVVLEEIWSGRKKIDHFYFNVQPVQTVTWVHGKASMGSYGTAQTIAFEGLLTLTAAINFDKNNLNYAEYGLYVPTGQCGVQLWENSIPSDTRPECNASPSPFTANGMADRVQDFSCT